MKSLFVTAFVLFVLRPFVFTPVPVPVADTTSGLVGYWKFDETSGFVAADASGSNNNGTVANSATWSSGNISGALAFNGLTQYVRMTAAGPLGNAAVTATAWIKTSSAGEQVFFAYGSDSGTGYAEYFRLNVNMNGTDRLGIRTGNGRRAFYAPGLSNGYWHHVAIVKASNDVLTNLQGYMDGVLLIGAEDSNPTASWNLGVGIPTIPVTVGADVQNGIVGSPFNGSIDDVRLYNRALSSADVADLYNAARPAQVTTTSATSTSCTGPWSLTRQEPATCRPYANSLWTKRLPADVFSHRQSNSEAAIDSIFRARDYSDKAYWLDLIWATPGGNDVSGPPVNYGQASDPLYKITCSFRGRLCATGTHDPSPYYFHLPVGSRFTTVRPGEDSFYTVWDQVNNRILGLYKVMDENGYDASSNKVQPCAGTTPETACELTLTGGVSTNHYTDTTDAIQNTGTPYGDSLRNGIDAMTIKASELMSGQINHAVYFVVDCINDGNTSSPGGIVEGINVFPSIPNGGGWGCSSTYNGVTRPDLNPKRPYRGNLIFADYTDAQIDAMNIPNHNKTLLKALAHYGGYVGDEQRPDNPGIIITRYESMQPYADMGLSGTQIPIWNWLQNTERMTCSPGNTGDSQCRFFFGTLAGVPDLPGPLCPTGACGPTKHFHIADPCIALGLVGQSGGCGSVPPPPPPPLKAPTGLKGAPKNP